jgi:hypothetical protein
MGTGGQSEVLAVRGPAGPSTDWTGLDIDLIFSHIISLRTRMEIVLEALVFSPFSHLMELVTWESFIVLSCLKASDHTKLFQTFIYY